MSLLSACRSLKCICRKKCRNVFDVSTKTKKSKPSRRKQFRSPKKDFEFTNNTSVYWLGNAGIFINSRGTKIMIDTLLEGFDMDFLIKMPISPKDIPTLDVLLITHDDNDRFNKTTCNDLKSVCKEYHDIGEIFSVGNMKIMLTPAEHNRKNESEKHHWRDYKLEDYCGFWIETANGKIWLPGDSRLLKEHLEMPQPDLILPDFADNSRHITFEGPVKLANTYPDTDLICIHRGSVDAPNMNTFNGDPVALAAVVVNPERVHATAPGEKFILQSH